MLIASDPTSPGIGRRAVVYRNGRLEADVATGQLAERAAEPGTLVWLDLSGPTEADILEIAAEFSLHPLAVDDIRRPQQRPKVDAYEELLLVVLFDVDLDARGHVELNEVAIFIGHGFVITVHARPIAALGSVVERWRQQPTMVEPSPVGFLLYRIASALVDSFFPITDHLDQRVERVEERMFERVEPRNLKLLLRLRRDLSALRRAITPQRDVFTTLARHDDDILDARTDPYFADIVDLVLRLGDTIDTTRDRLAAALESQLTLQSTELNQTMKRLTALTVVIMLPTLVAGVYGMNFDVMPELHWPLGYPFAVAVMLASACVAILVFWRNDWL